jgi:acetoacetyl-CoA synthetase
LEGQPIPYPVRDAIVGFISPWQLCAEAVAEGTLLWEPDADRIRRAKISSYIEWMSKNVGKRFGSYDELWRWSVDDLEGFWESILRHFEVNGRGNYSSVLSSRSMPGCEWFPGLELNYTEYLFRSPRQGTALLCRSEQGEREVSWGELERMVAAASEGLRELGVVKGDRVVAYLPNGPEAVVAFLASASMGAVWSSCPPEHGVLSVIDRFKQIEPKVLLTVDGYTYGGKYYDRSEAVRGIVNSLPTLQKTVLVDRHDGATSIGPDGKRPTEWEELLGRRAGKIHYEPVPFSHPIWVLYSSGTTGLPKPIVHGQGGILLEHLKGAVLHNDLGPGDRFLWLTTTGWMMWNYLVGGLLSGSTIVLYDGSSSFPNMNALWDVAEKTQLTFMGVSASYVAACMKAGIEPASTHRLDHLRGIGSTGSPLSPEGFEWLYSHVKRDLWVASISGGTDICSVLVGGCPILPVYSGEIQCRWLGAEVEAFNEQGNPVTGKMGELVVTEPLPSMPLFFWGDREGARYRESYFETFPGVWRHGDWIMITERGTSVIYGRSDATIKRMGVRIGTSEIYRSVESMPEVADSLAVDVEVTGGRTFLLLFVVPAVGKATNGDSLGQRIKQKIREDVSPRHVPDEVLVVKAIPRTLSGKKLEVPIKRILQGADPAKVLNRGSLGNPDAVDELIEIANRLRADGKL